MKSNEHRMSYALSTAFLKNGHKAYSFVYSDLGERPRIAESGVQTSLRQEALSNARSLRATVLYTLGLMVRKWSFIAECPFLSLVKSICYIRFCKSVSRVRKTKNPPLLETNRSKVIASKSRMGSLPNRSIT